MSNNQAIKEAKKMQNELTIRSDYDTNSYVREQWWALQELIERLDKQPEQSRYDIAMEILQEFRNTKEYISIKPEDEISSFGIWLEEKQNNS